MKLRLAMLILLIAAPFGAARADDDAAAVATTLDRFHTAAATADWDTYFTIMSDKGVFLGTDASERWEKQAFERFARGTKGWVYKPVSRNITFSDDKNTAWFDESLHSVKFGTCRSTGVLIRENGVWHIAQYSLSFPIPNDIADGITQEIQVFEQRQKTGQK